LDEPILRASASGEAGGRKNGHPTCGSNGQSLVEFALVVPLLLLLVLGAVEIGRAAYYAIAVVNAARSGVQYGAQNHTTAGDNVGIQQAAVNDFPMLSLDNVTIDTSYCECPDGSVAPNCEQTDCPVDNRFIPYLKVNTQMQIMSLVGFPGLPPSVSITGEAIMRIGN
jgi:hypothetical protein